MQDAASATLDCVKRAQVTGKKVRSATNWRQSDKPAGTIIWARKTMEKKVLPSQRSRNQENCLAPACHQCVGGFWHGAPNTVGCLKHAQGKRKAQHTKQHQRRKVRHVQGQHRAGMLRISSRNGTKHDKASRVAPRSRGFKWDPVASGVHRSSSKSSLSIS